MTIQSWVGHGATHFASEALGPGLRAWKSVTHYAAPLEVPGTGELFEAGLRGWIPEQDVESMARLNGAAMNLVGGPDAVSATGSHKAYVDAWNQLYYSKQRLPETSEWLEISNRNFLAPVDVWSGLRQLGFYDKQQQKWVQNLQYDIPGPADLVRFSIRHVWEPDLLENIGYDKEFPGGIIDVWHAMKGLDYPLFTGPFKAQIDQTLGGAGSSGELVATYAKHGIAEPTWARAYWWSHWVLPSPTQGYLMWQRLAPDRDVRWDGPEMAGLTFTLDDLNLLLRANDYPPKYRPLLAAISRPIPGIRFARDFRAQGVYDLQDLYRWGLRQGYSPGDAGAIATDIDAGARKKEEAPAACKRCREAEQLYETGVIGRDELIDFYQTQGQTVAQSTAAADLEDLRLKGIRARQVVSTIRSRYLGGELSDDQARGLLSQFGLVGERIADYLADWSLERFSRRKQVNADRAIKWACKGLITMADLNQRLVNLGYAPDDIRQLVTEANLCQLSLAAKAAADQAKAAAAQIKQLKEAQRAAAQQLTAARRALASHGSPAQLRKWFCEGHVGEPEVYQRLNFLGWPDVDIGRLIGDCKSGQTGKPGPGTAGGQTGSLGG